MSPDFHSSASVPADAHIDVRAARHRRQLLQRADPQRFGAGRALHVVRADDARLLRRQQLVVDVARRDEQREHSRAIADRVR